LGNQTIAFGVAWNFARIHKRILHLDSSYFDTKKGRMLNSSRHIVWPLDLREFRLPVNYDGNDIDWISQDISLLMIKGKNIRSQIQSRFPRIFQNFWISRNIDEIKLPPTKVRLYGDLLNLTQFEVSVDSGFKIEIKKQPTLNSRSSEILKNAIHIHVRFGDLIASLPQFYLNKQYYSRAIEVFDQIDKALPLVLYSNEPKRAMLFMKSFSSNRKVFAIQDFAKLSTAQEFDLFQKSQNKITSNSSFSLAAAILNPASNFSVFPRRFAEQYGGIKDAPNRLVIDV
jgi:hypothetical protein